MRPGRTQNTPPTREEKATWRELEFKFPEYTGTITELGQVKLRGRSYRCSLWIEDSQQSGAALDSLFALASSPDPAPSGTDSALPEMILERGERGRISLRYSGGATLRRFVYSDVPLEGKTTAAAEVGRRIRVLIEDRLRGPLEERCGPFPPIAGPVPTD